MRKGLYLVAAFMMGGATLTLNSCIETTEPTGIEAMRTAKADYLKALAQFRSAKAQLEMIEVEKAKLELELLRIEHEANKLEAMAAAQEAMYAYYVRLAEAEQEYIAAIIKIRMAMTNMKDEVVAEEMLEYEAKLSKAMEGLNASRKRLAMLEVTKYIFEKDKELFVEYMEMTLVEKTQEIEILEGFIAKLEEIAKISVTDTENLEKQLVEAKQALKDLDKEEVEKMREILKKKQYTEADARDIAKYEKNIYDEQAKKKDTRTFTINRHNVSTNISEDFNNILRDFDETLASYSYQSKMESKTESNIAEIFDIDGLMIDNYTLSGIQLNEYESIIRILINKCKAKIDTYYGDDENNNGNEEKNNAWNSIIKTMENQVAEAEQQIKSIDDGIAKIKDQIKSIKDKYDAKLYWSDELECFMIKGSTTVTVDGKKYEVFSEANPYSTVAELGNIATRGKVLQETIAQLEYAIRNKTYDSFICYDETTGKVVTIGGNNEESQSLEKFIAEKKEDLLSAKEDKAQIEGFLKSVKEKGIIFYDPEEGDELGLIIIDEINDVIEATEREVAAYETIVDVYKTTINKIIEAYESGELYTGIPEAGYEAPETDEPATDEPEGEEE